jgi:hypothetical protein
LPLGTSIVCVAVKDGHVGVAADHH